MILLKSLLIENIESFSENLEKKYNKLYPPPSKGTPSDVAGIVIQLFYYHSKENIELSGIYIPKVHRNKGIGSDIMAEIINYADLHNMTVVLTPSTDFGGSSVSRLKKFYKRFGFVENKGRNKDYRIYNTMYRRPE